MRKTRLYLEASPIIRVDDSNSPIRQAITKEFFRIVTEKSDEYELVVSPVTIEELEAGVEKYGKGAILFLNSLEHTELSKNDDVENLAWTYVANGVLSEKHIDDLSHVAYAVISRCDYIVTWNMRHLANDKTVSHVNTVNAVENYGKIYIATPEFFTGGKIYGK